MKFFNIDCHCSVIEDVAGNLKHFDHSVESHSISGHSWALGGKLASRGTGDRKQNGHVGYGAVNMATWERMFWGEHDTDAVFKIGRTWHDENPQLDDFDGFIACYPPSFSLLYEKFAGHVIIDIPVRYEQPFTNAPDLWKKFNDYLVNGSSSGKLTIAGNSLYEALYYEYFTGQPALHISSTCEYIDRLCPKWTIDNAKTFFYAFGEHAGCRAAAKAVPSVKFIRDVKDYYKHVDVVEARGVVWIPYNCSIMSFFEHYWLNIPLFVPTQRFLLELWDAGLALSQFSWHDPPTGGSHLPQVGTSLPDPNSTDGVIEWMQFYDFFNASEFPHVSYFDSWAELHEQLASVDGAAVSKRMAQQNVRRKTMNLMKWGGVLDRVKAWR